MEFDGSFGGLCSWRSSILVTSRVKRHENIIFCIPGFTKFTMKFRWWTVRCSTISSQLPPLGFQNSHKYGRQCHFPNFSGVSILYHLGVAPWELVASEGAGVGEGFKVLVSSLATKTSRNLCWFVLWYDWYTMYIMNYIIYYMIFSVFHFLYIMNVLLYVLYCK